MIKTCCDDCVNEMEQLDSLCVSNSKSYFPKKKKMKLFKAPVI